MEHIPVHCSPGCDHTLTVESFAVQWERGWASRELVLSQAEKVLPSYEQAKAAMSREGIHELYMYLKTTRWVSTADRASNHQAYRNFRGTAPHRPNPPRPYYPFFFVVRALFPESEAVKKMYLELEHHWGVRLDPKQPFYPRLDDPEQERKLIMGHVHPTDPDDLSTNDPVTKPTSYPGLSTGQIITAPSELDKEPSYTLADTNNQAANNSGDNNGFQSCEEEISSIRDYIEKRLSNVQNNLELQKNVART